MDISRIERRIKKINSVLDVFKEDNKLSLIEKDLLLGYVRELYDLIRESDAEVVEVKHEPIIVKSQDHKEVKPELVKVLEDKKPEPIVENEKAVIELVAEPIIETPVIITPIIEEKKIVVEKVEVKEAVKQTVTESVTITQSTFNISEDLEAIFIQEEVSDLSEKISMSRIEDISKVIGINERIFTINELFGSDAKLFESTLSKLNKASNFEEAKGIIINEVALPKNWEKDNKLKKAQQFIKHVRRKFN